MKNTKKSKGGSKYLVIGGIIILAAIIFIVSRKGETNPSNSALDNFTKCITEKGAVMYGAFWCPHCARTKKRFGSSFRYVNYIECDPRGDNAQADLCISKGIDKYDTWEFTDGTRIIPEPTFEQLSQKTGCQVPAK